MDQSLAPRIDTPISIAVAHINARDLHAANACVSELLARDARHPVALYLAGFIAFEQERWRDAEGFLRDALRESPEQERIIILLARTLRMTAQAQEARALCRSVPRPNLELQLEMANCEEAAGDVKAAESIYRALSQQPPDVSVALAFTQFLLRRGRPLEAEQAVRNALKATGDEPAKAQLEHQLGRALKLQHRHHEAISVMEAAASRGLIERDSTLEHAGLAAQTGRFDDAIALYEAQLERTPWDLETHALLNDLYCVQGRHDQVGKSYDDAVTRAPGIAALPVAKGQLLLKIGDLSAAEKAFRDALRMSPGHAVALTGLGLVLERSGNISLARATHAENGATNPHDGAALEAFGAFLLRHDDPRAALDVLQKAVRARPQSQSSLALLGLAYRACRDSREEWLNDYLRDVQIFDLEPPQGFADMNIFNAELTAYLRTLHAKAREYPSQTLRGGTQTYDGLFYQGHRLVDLLLDRINGAVQGYRSHLIGRGAHPFTSRLAENFRHIGSWSSCLHDQGYHVNHIHQKGWISSCYYAAVPDTVKDADTQEGWLKFGAPPSEFGLDWAPRKFVQPVPGRLVLFPSYMWHGTVPFHSAQERITIAFDTVPA